MNHFFPCITFEQNQISVVMLDILLKKPVEKEVASAEIKVSDKGDKPLKSVIKSISWRIVGTLDTILISYLITGRVSVAVSIGGIEAFTKTILYYFHERLWAHIHRININLWFRSNGK